MVYVNDETRNTRGNDVWETVDYRGRSMSSRRAVYHLPMIYCNIIVTLQLGTDFIVYMIIFIATRYFLMRYESIAYCININ